MVGRTGNSALGCCSHGACLLFFPRASTCFLRGCLCGEMGQAVATSSPRGAPCKELITFEAAIMSRANVPNIMPDP
jgi:hypothetical protein